MAFSDYIYHWVDKNGVRHYSNTSCGENAETIQEQQSALPETPAPLTQEKQAYIDKEQQKADELKAIKERVKQGYQSRIPVTPKPEKKQPTEIPPSFTVSTPTYNANSRTVSITGRVQAFHTLKYASVTAYVADENGFKTVITCYASDISGGTTKLLQGSRTFLGEHGSHWKLISFDSHYR